MSQVTVFCFSCTILSVFVVRPRELVRLKELTLGDLLDTLNMCVGPLEEKTLGAFGVKNFQLFGRLMKNERYLTSLWFEQKRFWRSNASKIVSRGPMHNYLQGI